DRRAARLALLRLDLGHLDRQELALAQELADVPGGVALEHAFVLLAVRIDRDVLVSAHRRRLGERSIRARDAQDFLERRRPREHLANAVLANARPARARVTLELVLARAVVNHRAHRAVDGDQLVDAG